MVSRQESARLWYQRNREKKLAQSRAWYAANRPRKLATSSINYRTNLKRKSKTMQLWYERNRLDANRRNRAWGEKLKRDVLTHYGKQGELLCCGENCDIRDIDMLTLDHIFNNGAADRKKFGKTSSRLYSFLRLNNYPVGEFQTLCANHQLKKEILRHRARRNSIEKEKTSATS